MGGEALVINLMSFEMSFEIFINPSKSRFRLKAPKEYTKWI